MHLLSSGKQEISDFKMDTGKNQSSKWNPFMQSEATITNVNIPYQNSYVHPCQPQIEL